MVDPWVWQCYKRYSYIYYLLNEHVHFSEALTHVAYCRWCVFDSWNELYELCAGVHTRETSQRQSFCVFNLGSQSVSCASSSRHCALRGVLRVPLVSVRLVSLWALMWTDRLVGLRPLNFFVAHFLKLGIIFLHFALISFYNCFKIILKETYK